MPKRILIFDDDPAIQEIMKEVLSYEGYDVKIAEDTFNFFKIINLYKPDLILLDFILQGINGGDISREIKTNAETANIPVILISAYPNVVEAMGDFKFDAFIAKPFEISEFLDKISSFIQKA